jgi:dihydroflavonol-4-reductase
MHVLLIGGNGFIGSATARALLAAGHSVRCLLRPTSKTHRIDGLTWERAEGDVRDAASVLAAARGCGAIIHLASPSSWDQIDSPVMDDVVVGGTRHVFAAARETGARVVYVSSATAVNGSPEPHVFDEDAAFTLPVARYRYARAKLQAEALCREAAAGGHHAVIVNPAEVYGPEDTELITAGNLIDFARSSPVFVCRGGTSVVHVDDVATGIVRALERGRPGERYILGGDNLSVEDLARRTLAILGQHKKTVMMPTGLVRAVAAAGRALHLPLPFNPRVIPYATLYWFMDAGKARRELDVTFRPADDVLRPALEWLRAAGRIE